MSINTFTYKILMKIRRYFMYYYGYNGGYANNMCAFPVNGYYSNNNGYGPAFILVLFILLVIIFGVGFWNNNNNN